MKAILIHGRADTAPDAMVYDAEVELATGCKLEDFE
jgi:hypothetical protein